MLVIYHVLGNVLALWIECMNKNDPAPASCGVQSLVGQKHGLSLDMMKWVRWLGFGEMSVFQAEGSL